MGMGPSYALPIALQRAGLTLDDLEIVEINEAFAAQVLAVLRETPVPQEKVNLRGGAIALGHPLGASGNRLLLTLARQLHEDGKKVGAATLCIGGGQGIAMIIESV
jgi:acetyl-CoA C-acetyltransferase